MWTLPRAHQHVCRTVITRWRVHNELTTEAAVVGTVVPGPGGVGGLAGVLSVREAVVLHVTALTVGGRGALGLHAARVGWVLDKLAAAGQRCVALAPGGQKGNVKMKVSAAHSVTRQMCKFGPKLLLIDKLRFRNDDRGKACAPNITKQSFDLHSPPSSP